MLKPKPSAKIVLAAYTLGAIGAIGQSLLLYNELSTTSPYTIVDADVYSSIGAAGFWFAPLAAVVCTVFVARRSVTAPVLMPVLLAPALFALVFVFVSQSFGFTAGREVAGGELSVASAAQQFHLSATWLAVAGFAAAFVAAVALKLIQSVRGLP